MTRANWNNAAAKIRRIFGILLAGMVIGCFINIVPVQVVHAETTPQATITVTQAIVSNDTPDNAVFTYRLVPRTTNAPMPPGGGADGFEFTITGIAEREIVISFGGPGVFVYELSCISGEADGVTVDRRIYTIEVYVTDDGQAVMTVYIQEGVKLPGINFEHIIKPEQIPEPSPSPEPVQTPSPTPGPEQSPTPTPGPSHTPSPTPGPIHTPSPSPTPGPSQTPSPTPSPSPHPTQTPAPGHSPGPGNTPTPGNIGKPGDNSPQTGDFSNPALWITLIAIAGASLIFILVFGGMRRRRGH